MIVDVDSRADISARGKVHVALIPVITQNDIVISKALVVTDTQSGSNTVF